MTKVYNYMIMAVGLTFLLKFAGIPSGADAFINWLGIGTNVENISLGTFFIGVAGIFAVGTGVGIAISFFTKTTPESFIVAPVALGIFTVTTSTFISIINYTRDFGFIYYLTYMIFIPLLAGFAIALVSFWRGSGG